MRKHHRANSRDGRKMNHITKLEHIVETLMDIPKDFQDDLNSKIFEIGYICAKLEVIIEEMTEMHENKIRMKENQRHGC